MMYLILFAVMMFIYVMRKKPVPLLPAKQVFDAAHRRFMEEIHSFTNYWRDVFMRDYRAALFKIENKADT